MKKFSLLLLAATGLFIASCSDDSHLTEENQYGVISMDMGSGVIIDGDTQGMQSKDLNHGDDGVGDFSTPGSDVLDWKVVVWDDGGSPISTKTPNANPDNFEQVGGSYAYVDTFPLGYYSVSFTNYATTTGDVVADLPYKVIEDVASTIEMQYSSELVSLPVDSALADGINSPDAEIVATPQMAQVEVTYDGFTSTTINFHGDTGVNLEEGKIYYVAPGPSVALTFDGTDAVGETISASFTKELLAAYIYTINFKLEDGEVVVTLSVDDTMTEGGEEDLIPGAVN